MSRKRRRVRVLVLTLAMLVSSLAYAQQPSSEPLPAADGGAPAQPVAPTPSNAEGSAATDGGAGPSAPAAPPGADEACVPACRAGFACVHGKCVSACNPPCAANEVCTAELQCVARYAPGGAPSAPGGTTSPPAVERARGVRTHDGFYFRVALGFGALVGGATISDNGDDIATGSLSAPSLVGELSLGGTVGRGVVLGVGNWNAVPIDPTMKYRLKTASGGEGPEREVSKPEVSPAGLLGPFIDWYPEPTEGFHVQFAAGLASGGYKEPGDDGDTITVWGGGGMFGIGYELWVADQWSIGFMARATSGYMTGSDPSDENEKHNLFFVSPGALVTFTYH